MLMTQALDTLVRGDDLSRDQMQTVMMEIMTGKASAAQIAGFLVALKIKGETIDEITGAASVMRSLAARVEVSNDYLVDTCGTGGDGSKIFNVSTASAFVAAAAGARVAKHGNRSVSSASGSADLLEQAGVNLSVSAAMVAREIDTIGIGFLFAPAHHSAMKHAIGPRKDLGMRTIFNLLGPLTNPAQVKRQVLGVYDQSLCRPLAEVLRNMGSEHVLVVRSKDGLDELSIAAPTHVAELKHGEIREFTLDPRDYDLAYDDLDGLAVNNASDSLAMIRKVFKGEAGAVVDKASAMVTFNAAAAIYVAGVADSLAEGVAMAEDAISLGAAQEKLTALAQFSNSSPEAETTSHSNPDTNS